MFQHRISVQRRDNWYFHVLFIQFQSMASADYFLPVHYLIFFLPNIKEITDIISIFKSNKIRPFFKRMWNISNNQHWTNKPKNKYSLGRTYIIKIKKEP